MINFSPIRTFSILNKEFKKIIRDPATLSVIFLIPILQIVLFGYAINVFPKNLPTAVISYDNSPFTRRFIQAVSMTDYFNIVSFPATEAEADKLMREGKINFILNIPAQFTHNVIKGHQPHILFQIDGTIPGGTGEAVQAIHSLEPTVFERQLNGPLNYLSKSGNSSPFLVDSQLNYNPSLLTTHAIVPGLIGVILTLLLISLTSVTITEEKQTGTIATLLNSPIQPLEIMIGKFLAYLFIGYIILFSIVLLSTKILFDVPFEGSLITLTLASFPFIAVNLMLGIAASAVSENERQAVQYSTLIFLPSILLSGFMFPFYGMPYWAQIIGNILPLTHYNTIVSGIMLKGYGWGNVLPELWPIVLFLFVVTYLAVLAFRKTIAQ